LSNYILNKLTKEKISILKKKVIKILIIKNGAKGISVFILIFFFEISIKSKLMIVPIQNDIITTQRPEAIPNIHPIPNISLPSPKPISFPLESNQRRTNGIDNIGPAKKVERVGSENNGPIPE
jgi:hypothetical protein